MKNGIYVFTAIFAALLFFTTPYAACAAEKTDVFESAEDGGDTSDDYEEELLGELDFGEMDDFLTGRDDDGVTFSELVQTFLTEGVGGLDAEVLFEWLINALAGDVAKCRTMLIEVVLLAFCFSILKNFAGAFQSSYIADLCFLLVYCVLAGLLLKTFSSFGEIVSGALNDVVDFMKLLVPAYCVSMMFSAGASSSIGFYQIAFLVIYLVEWLFLTVLMPMIHIYVLMEIFGHFVPEERFSNLSGLLFSAIGWGMKIAGVLVLGLNVVQSLIAPAKDRISQGALTRAVSIIPGVGAAVGSMSELLLGAGIVIKNCVGAAGLVALLFLGAVPLLKAACLAFFYKLAAAVTEPVTDKRICGCLKGMANGGVLYLKLLGYGLLLFFVTIALATAASSYIY